MLRQVVAMSCVCVGSAMAADTERLTGTAIKAMLAGSTVELDTPLGSKVPIRYSDDGAMTGEAGKVATYLGAATDSGRWWIAGDRLCHKWARWFDGEIQCLSLAMRGRQIDWRRDDGQTGTATVSLRPTSAALRAAPYGLGAREPVGETARVMPSIGQASVATAPAAGAIAAPQPAARAAARVASAPMAAAPPAAIAKAGTAKSSPVATGPVAAAQPAKPAPPARPTPRASAAVMTEPAFKVIGVDQSDVLQLRAGPSAEHASIGIIPPQGRGVKIVGQCVQTWCPVQHRGFNGWVNAIYLAEDTPRDGTADRPTTAPRGR